MQRNRGKFNQPRRGNMLNIEQRKLVDKQQEMLRNTSFNQGINSYRNQETSALPQLGNKSGFVPSFLKNSSILPLMSSSALLPPPSVGSLPNAPRQSSLFSPGPSSNTLYGGVQSQFRSRELGAQQSGGLKIGSRQGLNIKPLISSPNSLFDRPYSSNLRFEDRSWAQKNTLSNEGFNWSPSNVESRNIKDRLTLNQNSFSGDRVWGKRSRDPQELSWEDGSQSNNFVGENATKRFKTSGWLNESRNDSWGKISNVPEAKRFNSQYVEPENKWNNGLKNQEGKRDNRGRQMNLQKNNGSNSLLGNPNDFNNKFQHSDDPAKSWPDKSLSKGEIPSNLGSKSNIGKNNLGDELLIKPISSEENLSKKDFWKKSKERPWVPPSNYSYSDSGKFRGNTIGPKNMREEDIRGHNENFIMNQGWDSLKMVEDSALQMKLRLLDNQLGQLDERMLHIHSGVPGQTPLLPVIWDNQTLFPQNEVLNTPLENNDLRKLLLNKAREGANADCRSDTDTGGWSDTMVLIYPFLKSTMNLTDNMDLKSQLSERIHALLDDNSQNIQPRFHETAMVCRNWFMIHCDDQTTVDWLLTWKPQIKAKSRMKLCIRKALDAVKITHISIILKGIKESIRDIEVRLIKQNQHLEPNMWRRGPHKFSQHDATVSFLIDAACLRLLEASSWEVYYEMSKFKVKILKHKPVIPLPKYLKSL